MAKTTRKRRRTTAEERKAKQIEALKDWLIDTAIAANRGWAIDVDNSPVHEMGLEAFCGWVVTAMQVWLKEDDEQLLFKEWRTLLRIALPKFDSFDRAAAWLYEKGARIR